MRLDDWRIVFYESSRPSTFPVAITGKVYGHKKLASGTMIATSRIKTIDNVWVQTENGFIYELGKKAGEMT